MDSRLSQARQHFKKTGEIIPLLQVYQQSGREDIILKLIRLYVPEASYVLAGSDLLTRIEEESDHIEGICPCLDCITVDRLQERLGEHWNDFLRIFRDLLSNRCKESFEFAENCVSKSISFMRLREVPSMADVLMTQLQLNFSLREEALKKLTQQVLETL